ncbi:MAG: hypothetical protein DMF85_00845 [Acidobacteria bacterium]|nr:MAG: hypothetical protein DMF85_00845 [Acidobacteriota bacterium]
MHTDGQRACHYAGRRPAHALTSLVSVPPPQSALRLSVSICGQMSFLITSVFIRGRFARR